MRIAILIVSIALAGYLVLAGIGCIFYMKQAKKDADHLGISSALTRFIGYCQIAAVVGLIAGLFWRPLGIAAATGVVLLMVGAVVFHRRVGDSIAPMMPALIVFALAAFVLAGDISMSASHTSNTWAESSVTARQQWSGDGP